MAVGHLLDCPAHILMREFPLFLKKILKNDVVLALILLAAFLLTNGYTYGWDDQHLEIPLLKNLIDPQLYAGDYYVESLRQHFSSFLYPLLAFLIDVKQIPAAYFVLYLLSRYFFFFFSLKLWKTISGETSTAVFVVLVSLSLGRVEEFLYRTFSHQEFALAIILAGLVLFYRDRFVWAAAVFGMAANFHSLYSLFPFLYMQAHFLLEVRQLGWRRIWQTAGVFVLCALPVLVWTWRQAHAGAVSVSPSVEEWLPLYRLACPQNFIFLDQTLAGAFASTTVFFQITRHYWPIFLLFLFNQGFHSAFRHDRKTQTLMGTGTFFIVVSFIFTYIAPSRLFLDLNLIRNLQFMLFFLIGYTAIFLARCAKTYSLVTVLGLAAWLPFFRFGGQVFSFSVIGLIGVLLMARSPGVRKSYLRQGVGIGLVLLSVLAIGWNMSRHAYSLSVYFAIGFAAVAVLLACWIGSRRMRDQKLPKALLLWIPVVVMLGHFTYYHFHRNKIEHLAQGGYWQLNKNWIDMQHYVRENTPPDALLLVPYDMTMGGFRIFSERRIICSYRDCGIVGFDYRAAREWQQRVRDIEPFKVFAAGDVTPAIENAIMKYKVQYIVFMNYMAPASNPIIERVYQNGVFSLYKVLPNAP